MRRLKMILKWTGLVLLTLTGRIAGWSETNFIDRFRRGKLIPKSPMPWSSYKRVTDAELKAIYKYLKTLKPVKTQPE